MSQIFENANLWLETYQSISATEKYDFIEKTLKQSLTTEFLFQLKSTIIPKLLDYKDDLEENKQFEKIFELIDLIHQNHSTFYEDYFYYLDQFAVEHSLFSDKNEKLPQLLEHFLEFPEKDPRIFLSIFTYLIFYQKYEIAALLAEKSYESLNDLNKVRYRMGDKVAIFLAYDLLQKYFEKFLVTKQFNANAYFNAISKYDIGNEKKYIAEYVRLFVENRWEVKNFKADFYSYKEYYLNLLAGHFLQTQFLQNQMNFAISFFIWDNISYYWERKAGNHEQHSEKYFAIDHRKFHQFLSNLTSDYFPHYEVNSFALLWGVVYLYEFLFSVELISYATYFNALESFELLKKDAISRYKSTLWKFDFVHRWTKPSSISQEKFDNEKQLFRNSFSSNL